MASIDLYGDFNDEADAQGEDNENPEEGDVDEGDNTEKVDPKLKVVRIKRKIPTLNAERLKGPRGIIAVDDFFNDIKFKGKGYEKQDLDEVMKRLEHWAHRMFPKYDFDDSLAAIERLGKKKEVAVHMTRYRLDQLTKDDDIMVSEGEVTENSPNRESHLNDDEPMDEFEALIDEQIALSTVQSRTNTTTKDINKSFGDISGISISSNTTKTNMNERISTNTQDFSQPSSSQPQHSLSSQAGITDEVRARIAENRRKAMERLQQRRKEDEEQTRKKQMEEKLRTQEISNINIDDDDF